MTEPTQDFRSILNRIATIDAGQQQAQAELEKIRTTLHSALILGAYTAGLAFLIYLGLRQVQGAVSS